MVGERQDKMERLRGRGGWWGCHSSSGNRAFDEYRTDTLKRLEDEQRGFRDFLALRGSRHARPRRKQRRLRRPPW
jgi:hypothetical protein